MTSLERNSSLDNFYDLFEFSKIQIWIEENVFKRIALQFPQNFLDNATKIALELEKNFSDKKFCILADTSYRSCCMNEIAVKQANCDSIIHFGDACLSQSKGDIPVLYIFGKKTIDLNKLQKKIDEIIRSDNFENNTILILCDSIYSSMEDEFEAAINSTIPTSASTKVYFCKLSQCLNASAENNNLILSRELPLNYQKMGKENDLLIFIGANDSPLLTIFRLTIPNLERILHFNPENNSSTYSQCSINKLLMKRLYLVEKMRDSHTVGLVIGSATLEKCEEAISRIRDLCKKANKKIYVFFIGKLNEAKLTNYGMDVDIFIMLSCPYGILLDEKKFYKPVISMVEAEMALNRNMENGYLCWTAEYQKILEMDFKQLEEADEEFSLTTGSIRSRRKNADKDDDDKQLVEYSAGDYFAQRTWRGLDEGELNGHFTILKDGRDGIASIYTGEPK